MKILIAPDSYKGSLTSLEVGLTIQKAFLEVMPSASIDVIPMADGGEGTLETILFATKGNRYKINITGPLGEKVETEYGVLGDGETVVIEIANICGLPMVPTRKRNPLQTTTYGIGEVIKETMNIGYRKFIIALGGSATNDGGLGMLQALGVTFLDETKKEVTPFGASVAKIKHIDFSTIDPTIKECVFQIASDVENPLCGENGASFVFGPQKGATSEMVKKLDHALYLYATKIEKHLEKSFQFSKGAGAAGGLGFAFLTLGGEIVSGAELIAQAVCLKDKMKNVDWVITGEGQSDDQTLFGKVPGYIGKLASSYHVKALLISGGLGKGYEELYRYFISCDSIVNGPMELETCMKNAENLLYMKAKNIARLLATVFI